MRGRNKELDNHIKYMKTGVKSTDAQKTKRAKKVKEHKDLVLSESMLKEKTMDEITESLLIAVAQAADKASQNEIGNEKWFIFDGYIDHFIMNLLNERIRLKRLIDAVKD